MLYRYQLTRTTDMPNDRASTLPSAPDVFIGIVTNFNILCQALVECETVDGQLFPGMTIRAAAAELREMALGFGLVVEDLIGSSCSDCAAEGVASEAAPLYSYGSPIAHPLVTACYRIGASANAISGLDGDAEEDEFAALPGFSPLAIKAVLADPDVVGLFETQGLSGSAAEQLRLLVEDA
jgi:hypothetical protein